MPEIKIKRGESIDSALKRLKERVLKEGILDEVRRLRAFETPKEKAIRKARRNAKIAKILRESSGGYPSGYAKSRNYGGGS